MGANKPIEDFQATLLAATKSALDELVGWSHATMAAQLCSRKGGACSYVRASSPLPREQATVVAHYLHVQFLPRDRCVVALERFKTLALLYPSS
jgi:hypothetical protein